MISTERLLLREWREDDRDAWAALNADPEVMEFFPNVLDRHQSDAAFDRIAATLDERGWGLWAADLDGRFVGFTGLAVPRFEAPFMPTVEIGWRFSREVWGHGYATEAARAVLEHAFADLALPEVVSFTSVGNVRSRRVMQRLGMTRDPADDFDNPGIESGHPLRRHVLYRIRSL